MLWKGFFHEVREETSHVVSAFQSHHCQSDPPPSSCFTHTAVPDRMKSILGCVTTFEDRMGWHIDCNHKFLLINKARYRRRSTHVPNLIDELSPAKERRLNRAWFIQCSSHVPNQMHYLWQCTIFPWCTPTLGSTHSTPSESVVALMSNLIQLGSAHEWSGVWTGPKLFFNKYTVFFLVTATNTLSKEVF